MARRRGSRPSNRQLLAVVAIILALLALTGIGGVPWLVLAVIVLSLTQLI
jgi:fatty acid desaturase